MKVPGLKVGFNWQTVIAGMGVMVVMPAAVSIASQVLRSVTKTTIKGGLIIYRKWKQTDSFPVQPSQSTEEGSASEALYEHNGTDTVFVSAKGKKYHQKDCPALPKTCKQMPLEDAIAAGYQACKLCSA